MQSNSALEKEDYNFFEINSATLIDDLAGSDTDLSGESYNDNSTKVTDDRGSVTEDNSIAEIEKKHTHYESYLSAIDWFENEETYIIMQVA